MRRAAAVRRPGLLGATVPLPLVEVYSCQHLTADVPCVDLLSLLISGDIFALLCNAGGDERGVHPVFLHLFLNSWLYSSSNKRALVGNAYVVVLSVFI